MKNRVHYGEYSLSHWINLILKENIVLPWYQRSFVWEKAQIENLVKTIDDNQFVPPVIIGAVRVNNEWKNYILDGQQRLTSILFAKCNKYIDKKEYAYLKPDSEIEQMADDVLDNEDEIAEERIRMIKWNFSEIIKDKKIDHNELESFSYKQLFESIKEDKFFDEHFLGFAYIKPSNEVKDEEQSKFYSQIFRNINVGGTKLTRLESRKSLYFLKEDLKDFFVPEFLDSIRVQTSSKESGLIDFIKYLAILAQYRGNNDSIVKYGGRDWEKNENYYSKYIIAVVERVTNNDFHFDISYPATPYNNQRIENLRDELALLEIPKSFNSIIEMDMYFFGLVYEIVFLNKRLDPQKKEQLKIELDAKINDLKNEGNHKDNPNALKYLKSRVEWSLFIYKKIEIQQNA